MASPINPNVTLLQAAKGTPSDKTPAPLAGPAQTEHFASTNLAPPSQLYIQRDDVLFWGVISQVTGQITLTARLLLAGTDRIQTIQDTITVNTAYVQQFKTLPLAEGYLLSLTINASNIVSTLPFAFVQALIVRGASASTPVQPGQVLIQQYISTDSFPSWPTSALIQPVDGPGVRRTVIVTNPAAGADWSVGPPAGAMWEVVSFAATLTTAVAVANRQVQIQILGAGGATLFQAGALANIAASTTEVVSAYQGTPYTSILATDLILPIPPRNKLAGTDLIRTVTAGIQAADQWSAIALEVLEWFLL